MLGPAADATVVVHRAPTTDHRPRAFVVSDRPLTATLPGIAFPSWGEKQEAGPVTEPHQAAAAGEVFGRIVRPRKPGPIPNKSGEINMVIL